MTLKLATCGTKLVRDTRSDGLTIVELLVLLAIVKPTKAGRDVMLPGSASFNSP